MFDNFYSLSRAANQLQAKRGLLLYVEQYIPELQTCVLKPSSEHYDAQQFEIVRTIIRQIYLFNKSPEQAIQEYLQENHGFRLSQKDVTVFKDKDQAIAPKETTQPQEADTGKHIAEIIESSDDQIGEKSIDEQPVEQPEIKESKNIKVNREKKENRSLDNAFEEPADWYYNKLYSESMGQKTFDFERSPPAYESPVTNAQKQKKTVADGDSAEKRLLKTSTKNTEQLTGNSSDQQYSVEDQSLHQQEQEQDTKQSTDNYSKDSADNNDIAKNIAGVSNGLSLLDKLSAIDSILDKHDTKNISSNNKE